MNILIIKTQAIGDVLMSLHMLESLRSYYGRDVNITWVCGNQVKPILEKVNGIDDIISFDESKLFKGGLIDKTIVLLSLWKKLFFKSFDKIIIGHSDWRYNLIYPFQNKNRVSFGTKVYKDLPLGTRYHGVDYCVLATSEEYIRDNKIKFPNVEFDRKKAFNNGKKVVLLFPGGANNTISEQYLRRWPIEYYAELANLLLNNGYHVIVSGAKSDEWINKYFSNNVKNLVGKTDLESTITLIKDVDCIVTHDSGPLHMSLLLTKTKTISIFGPVLDIARIPKNLKHSMVLSDYNRLPECSPCYSGKGFVECTDNKCMKVYKAQEVKLLIDKIILENKQL
jgi:ADP-heptose:LPS heptosyltransferase